MWFPLVLSLSAHMYHPKGNKMGPTGILGNVGNQRGTGVKTTPEKFVEEQTRSLPDWTKPSETAGSFFPSMQCVRPLGFCSSVDGLLAMSSDWDAQQQTFSTSDNEDTAPLASKCTQTHTHLDTLQRLCCTKSVYFSCHHVSPRPDKETLEQIVLLVKEEFQNILSKHQSLVE